MASPFSKPADFGQFIPPINLDLVNFTLQAKQQKFDHNLANLEASIQEKFGNIDLHKEVDKQHFLQRAAQSINELGDLSKVDFSKSGSVRNINRQLSTIIDDRVINDIVSTKNFRNFQKQAQEMRSKNLDKFSETNFQFAMTKGGINDWLENKTTTLGEVNLPEFVDLAEVRKDIALNLDKFAKVTKSFRPDGSFFFINTEKKELSPEEVKNIAEQFLSDKAKQQITINGWANFDGGTRPKEEIITDFQKFSNTKLESLDTQISKLELQKANLGSTSPENTKILDQNIAQLKDFKLKLGEEHVNWVKKGQFDSMTATMEKENFLNSFANTFAISDIKEDIKPNQVALAQFRQSTSATKTDKVNPDGTIKIEGVTVVDFQNDLKDKDLLKENTQKIRDFDTTFKQEVNKVFETLDPKVKSDIEKQIKPNDKLSKEEQLFNLMEGLNTESTKIISAEDFERINAVKQTLDVEKDKYDRAHKTAVETQEKKLLQEIIPKFEGNIIDNTSVELTDFDGKNLGSLTKILADKGIKTTEDLLKDKNLTDLILANIYSEEIATELARSKQNSILAAAANAGVTPGAFLLTQPGIKVNKGLTLRLKEIVKDDKKINILLDSKKSFGSRKALGDKILFVQSLAPFNRDVAFSDVGLTKFIDDDKINKNINDLLKEELRVKRDKALSIDSTTDIGKQVVNAGSDVKITSGNPQLFTSKIGKNLSIVNVSADEVEVSQVGSDGKLLTTKILKQNLPEGIKQQFLFDDIAPNFTKENMKPKERQFSFRDANETGLVRDIAQAYFFGDKALAGLTTKQGITQKLGEDFPDLFKGDGNVIETSVNKLFTQGNLKSKIVQRKDEFFEELVIIDPETKEEVSFITSEDPIPEDQLDLSLKAQRGFPQLKVFVRVQAALTAFLQNPKLIPEELKTIIDVYGK